jgi:RimJ/RimL family protein N-acetyltransferase
LPELRLLPYAAEHVADVQAFLDDEAVLAFTPVPEPVPPGHAEGWLARFGDEGAWVVLDGQQLVAFACAPQLDRERGQAELGYLVHPDARGRGVAQFALRTLTEWAFGQGIHRVELHINVDNAASLAVARRCGFQLEGTLRDTFLKAGRRVDTTVWSRLASDPKAVAGGARGAYGQGMKS